MGKEPKTSSRQYVVGQQDEGFCWLLDEEGSRTADDQNIELARRFTSLEDAEAVADEHMASVFEIIDANAWPARLEEVY